MGGISGVVPAGAHSMTDPANHPAAGRFDMQPAIHKG